MFFLTNIVDSNDIKKVSKRISSLIYLIKMLRNLYLKKNIVRLKAINKEYFHTNKGIEFSKILHLVT